MAPFPSPTSKWHDTTYPSLSPTRPELSAKGNNVIITGGGTGVGSETARYFAKAGASRIAILGRREQPLLDTKASLNDEFPEVEVFVSSTDVTKKVEVDNTFAAFTGNGKLDVVVSNAGIIGPHEAIGDTDPEELLKVIQSNLSGSLHVAQAFLRHASTNAVAIEISSGVARENMGPKYVSYSIAKMAIIRLWDALAYTHPELSIFHLHPGVVDTTMNREAGGVKAAGFEDHVSLPASFIVWLSSPEARFLKSKFLWSNWDVDELKSQAKEIESSGIFRVGLGGWPFDSVGTAGDFLART